MVSWLTLVLHFNITAHPSARWTAQQLREAFPFTAPPQYLLRDRDDIYGLEFQHTAQILGCEQLRIAPQSPWQSPNVDRLIDSIRRDCLDHVIVLNQTHLHRLLQDYFAYYHRWRTHLGLHKDAPELRRVHNGCRKAKSLPSPKSVASIIITNAGRPEIHPLMLGEDCCPPLKSRPGFWINYPCQAGISTKLPSKRITTAKRNNGLNRNRPSPA